MAMAMPMAMLMQSNLEEVEFDVDLCGNDGDYSDVDDDGGRCMITMIVMVTLMVMAMVLALVTLMASNMLMMRTMFIACMLFMMWMFAVM